jgi:hypothetical protein
VSAALTVASVLRIAVKEEWRVIQQSGEWSFSLSLWNYERVWKSENNCCRRAQERPFYESLGRLSERTRRMLFLAFCSYLLLRAFGAACVTSYLFFVNT